MRRTLWLMRSSVMVGDGDVLIPQLTAQLILQDDGRHGTGDFRTRDVGLSTVGTPFGHRGLVNTDLLG